MSMVTNTADIYSEIGRKLLDIHLNFARIVSEKVNREIVIYTEWATDLLIVPIVVSGYRVRVLPSGDYALLSDTLQGCPLLTSGFLIEYWKNILSVKRINKRVFTNRLAK